MQHLAYFHLKIRDFEDTLDIATWFIYQFSIHVLKISGNVPHELLNHSSCHHLQTAIDLLLLRRAYFYLLHNRLYMSNILASPLHSAGLLHKENITQMRCLTNLSGVPIRLHPNRAITQILCVYQGCSLWGGFLVAGLLTCWSLVDAELRNVIFLNRDVAS